MAAYCFGNVTNVQINWSLCIICQEFENTQKALKCPLLCPGLSRGDKGVAYKWFLANVKSFRDIDALPTKLYFGNDMSADGLLAHCASWHKSCHFVILAKAASIIREDIFCHDGFTFTDCFPPLF